MKKLVILLLSFTFTAYPATYYIDFASGNDANSGASTSAPWKRAPGMKNFGRTYINNPGDRFIFKGGVTWDASCFQMKMAGGGSSEANRSYYGIDVTWYTGGSWTRPVFDFQRAILGTWGYTIAGVLVDAVSYITFEGIDFTNHRAPWNGQYGATTWGGTVICCRNSNNIRFKNIIVRDWDQPSGQPIDTASGGGILKIEGGSGLEVEDSLFHQDNTPFKNAAAIWSIGSVKRCEIRNVASAMLGINTVHDNWIHHLWNPWPDLRAHANVMLIQGHVDVARNLIHDTQNYHEIIYLEPTIYGFSGIARVYDNVVWNTVKFPLTVDNTGAHMNPAAVNAKVYAWNNTFVGVNNGSGSVIAVGQRNQYPGGPPMDPVYHMELTNNHFITSGPLFLQDGAPPPTTFVHGNNITNTPSAANAAGYTIGNHWAPTSGAAPTVDAGVTLSHFNMDRLNVPRPQGVAWDIGAYEFTSGASSPGTLAIATSAYSTAEDTTVAINVIRVGGSMGTVGCSYTTTAGTALAGTDYTTASGTLSFIDSDVSETVNVTILRNVANTGNRSFTFTISAPTGGTSLSAPTATTVTIIDSDPPVVEIPTLALNFVATNMLMSAPFTADANGIVSQPSQTATNTAGTLMAKFEIPTAGDYHLILTNNAPSQSSDSFFIRVDGTNDAFHIPATVGLEERYVSWQGSSNAPNSEFNPMVWTFAESQEVLLVIYGREGGAGVHGGRWSLITGTPIPQQFAFSVPQANAREGGIVILTVVRSSGITGAETVDYATVNGSATSGVDYVAASGTLEFADSEESKTISIELINDDSWVGNRSFTVVLSNPSAGTALVSPSTCVISIDDDEVPPVIRTLRVKKLTIGRRN